jgi:hypothetical protein
MSKDCMKQNLIRIIRISVNLCESVVKNLSIKNIKLCKTNPILSASGGFQIAVTLIKTMTTNFYPPSVWRDELFKNKAKQTQSNPILSASQSAAQIPECLPAICVAGRYPGPSYFHPEPRATSHESRESGIGIFTD